MAIAFCSVLKALLTRLVFAVHCILAIWRVVTIKHDPLFWLLLAALGLLLIETFVTLIKKKGDEWKWFCPSFFFYLLGVVPAIWFLELDKLHRARQKSMGNETAESNNTQLEGLTAIKGIEIPIALDADMWVNAIENVMLFLLIIGRWLLPKGEITRDQLSQLLFVYIGMASDIMELFYLFQEEAVLRSELLGYLILGVWNLSLLQFCMVLTATKARKRRVAMDHPEWRHKSISQNGRKQPARKAGNDSGDDEAEEEQEGNCCERCCATEIWSIMIMVLMQDGPFLSVRLYVLITYDLLSYNILFFTAKNALVISLQFYRLVVISCEMRRQSTEEDEENGGDLGRSA